MIVKDSIVMFYGGVGLKRYLRVDLSPDPTRITDDWMVDPTSPQLTINGGAIGDPEGLFVQLLQAKDASINANYNGPIDGGGTPLDKIAVADFTIVPGSATFPTVVPSSGNKQPTFALASFSCVVGRLSHLRMFPKSGSVLTVNPMTCAILGDDNQIDNTKELVTFLLSRSQINATPYLDDNSNVVKLQLETIA